jgi:hypothetical protein
MQKKNQGREQENLKMKIVYKIYVMKCFTLNGSGLQIWFQFSEEQRVKQDQLPNL